jgi:hypothetical protein
LLQQHPGHLHLLGMISRFPHVSAASLLMQQTLVLN